LLLLLGVLSDAHERALLIDREVVELLTGRLLLLICEEFAVLRRVIQGLVETHLLRKFELLVARTEVLDASEAVALLPGEAGGLEQTVRVRVVSEGQCWRRFEVFQGLVEKGF